MSVKRTILFAGTIDLRGEAIVCELLDKGHTVRLFNPNPGSSAVVNLQSLGATLYYGDLNDKDNIDQERFAQSVLNCFTVIIDTPYMQQAFMAARVCRSLNIRQVIYLSCPGKIPKQGGEKNYHHMVEGVFATPNLPWTIIAPGSLAEEFLTPHNFDLQKGILSLEYAPEHHLQLLALADLTKFFALVVKNPARFLGQRIELSSFTVSCKEAANALSVAYDRQIDYEQRDMIEYIGATLRHNDPEPMFLNHRVEGSQAMRRLYSEINWYPSFVDWAWAQNFQHPRL